MKKTIKKTAKKIKEVSTPTNICPVCNGSGLWRPDYTNSPQCEACLGHGVITN